MRYFLTMLTMLTVGFANAQPVLTPKQEQQLEQIAEREEAVPEDESLLQQLETFQRYPINLNTAIAEELAQLQMLSALQVKALLQYRHLLGNIIHIYELQAIPYWDVLTIQKLLPYITIHEKLNVADHARKSIGGENVLLFRLSQSFGADTTNTRLHLGSPQKILVRYRYTYKNLLQFGLLADKDAGEPLFKEKQKTGFDFYSFHLFARNMGIIQSLAVGDFTVNLGQGLIHWQSLALGKSTEIAAIKRQSAVLRPYNSAGEFNFHRGLGITLRRKHMQLMLFGSARKSDANLSIDAAGETSISSFLITGLHRTAAEMEKRNNTGRRSIGGNISYADDRWQVSGNYIYHEFSFPVNKKEEPYNLFAFKGKQLANYSIDYDGTWQNMHFFGELAAGPGFNTAMLNGVLISLDRKADASLVVRHLQPGFQSLQAAAFTENSVPSNESGVFVSLSLRPYPGIRLDLYADVFRFPWLKFRADAPSSGKEYLLQLVYQPNKKFDLSARFRYESKQTNVNAAPFNEVVSVPRANWRIHINWQPFRELRLRQRVELVWYDRGGNGREEGYLIYNDISWQPAFSRLTMSGRMQFFETNGFNSRIYAFENDVASGYAVTSTYHKGMRYYLNLKISLSGNKISSVFEKILPSDISLRYAQTFYAGLSGSVFQHNILSEYKLQLIFSSF